MANLWDKFDNAMDTEKLKKDVSEASQGTGDFPEVPHGTYEVEIEKLELTESKKGSPMVSCWFKIVKGEFKGQRLFMNQVLTNGFGIHMSNEFLRSLDSGIPEAEIIFESFAQYGQMIMDVHEAVDGNLEFEIEYGEKKGYSTFKVTEVFDK